MREAAKALYSFFSSFGIPAYDENTVPDDAKLPYITYTPVDTNWQDVAPVTASVWYEGTSFNDLFAKVDEIKNRVGEGLRVPASNGCIWIYRDNPWAQMQPTDKDDVKVVYLIFGVHCLCD